MYRHQPVLYCIRIAVELASDDDMPLLVVDTKIVSEPNASNETSLWRDD